MTTEEIKALLVQFLYWIAEKPDMLDYESVAHAADHFMQEDPFRMYPSSGPVFAIEPDPDDIEMESDNYYSTLEDMPTDTFTDLEY